MAESEEHSVAFLQRQRVSEAKETEIEIVGESLTTTFGTIVVAAIFLLGSFNDVIRRYQLIDLLGSTSLFFNREPMFGLSTAFSSFCEKSLGLSFKFAMSLTNYCNLF